MERRGKLGLNDSKVFGLVSHLRFSNCFTNSS